MPKKKWTKPMLIVLVKGRPEEVVLAYCKVAGFIGIVGPNVLANGCWLNAGPYAGGTICWSVCSGAPIGAS